MRRQRRRWRSEQRQPRRGRHHRLRSDRLPRYPRVLRGVRERGIEAKAETVRAGHHGLQHCPLHALHLLLRWEDRPCRGHPPRIRMYVVERVAVGGRCVDVSSVV